MTLILTYKEPVQLSPKDGSILPRKVHFAVDRMVGDGFRYGLLVNPKYATLGLDEQYLFAFAGSLRIGQVLSSALKPLSENLDSSKSDDYEFTLEHIVPAFQEALVAVGLNPFDDKGIHFEGVLVTPSRKVFILDSELSICELEDESWFSGSGSEAARTAWDIFNDQRWDIFDTVEERIQNVFKYVSRNDPSVSDKIDYRVLVQND